MKAEEQFGDIWRRFLRYQRRAMQTTVNLQRSRNFFFFHGSIYLIAACNPLSSDPLLAIRSFNPAHQPSPHYTSPKQPTMAAPEILTDYTSCAHRNCPTILPRPRTPAAGIYICHKHERQLHDAVAQIYEWWFKKGRTPEGATPANVDVWGLRGGGRRVV